MRQKLPKLAISAALGALLLGGCSAATKTAPPELVPPAPTAEPPPSDPPPSLPHDPAPPENPIEEDTSLAGQDETLPTELDPPVAAMAFAYYRLDDVQMVVVGEQAIDEYDLTDEVTQELREHFSEMGMRLQNAEGVRFHRQDAESIRDFAANLDADLVTVVVGEARERANLGQMYSYEAEIRATIYEAAGDIVTTREITAVGGRSSDAQRAADSALRAAADELGPFLSEQLIRKVGQNVITRRLVVTDLRYYASVTKIMTWLKKQPGINDVRLMSWDERSGTARFIIYLQPAAKDNLGIYVTDTPDLEVRIRHIDQAGTTGEERRINR
jgi:hypothetical protein